MLSGNSTGTVCVPVIDKDFLYPYWQERSGNAWAIALDMFVIVSLQGGRSLSSELPLGIRFKYDM